MSHFHLSCKQSSTWRSQNLPQGATTARPSQKQQQPHMMDIGLRGHFAPKMLATGQLTLRNRTTSEMEIGLSHTMSRITICDHLATKMLAAGNLKSDIAQSEQLDNPVCPPLTSWSILLQVHDVKRDLIRVKFKTEGPQTKRCIY